MMATHYITRTPQQLQEPSYRREQQQACSSKDPKQQQQQEAMPADTKQQTMI
jgi:hypothetical protein